MKTFEPKLIAVFKSKTYTAKNLISDLTAGLIVAIIALPLSIALAIASGATPETGLYTAVIGGFVISALGGSRVNISGPTAAFATIVAGIIAGYGMEGLMLATIMAGIILVILGICRVGSLIKFIPHTITVGFTSGIAVTLVIGQLKEFLGLTYPDGTNAIETLDKLGLVFTHISTVNLWAVLVGVVGLAVLILWPKLCKKIPGSLIAVLVGAVAVSIANLSVNTIGTLYTLKSGLPKFNLPTVTFNKILTLFPNALTISLLAGIESLLSCVVSDGMINDKHNSNTELIAQGVGNICVGFFGGIPATGAIARTAANVKNGGRSPVAGMTHALVLLLVLVLLIPYASLIPMPVISAILFVVAYNMSEWREFVKIIKTRNPLNISVLILTFVLTVAFDLVKAIAVGMVVYYAVFFIKKAVAKKRLNQSENAVCEIKEEEPLSIAEEE